MNSELKKFLFSLTAHQAAETEENLTEEEIVPEEIPVFTGDHGDPYFDEEQALINEVLARCDLHPVPITDEVSHMPCYSFCA